MKRIGADIDDTITYTNPFLIEEAIKYDKLIGGKGFKDKDAYNFTDMFYWTPEDKANFFNYLKENEIMINLGIREDFKDVMEELNKHAQIYFVSARSGRTFKDSFSQTEKWLKDNNIIYKMLYTNIKDKAEVLKENKIDLFIDDFTENCEAAINAGIDAIVMASDYNKDTNLKRVENWYQVLEYIRKCEDEESIN